MRLSCKLFCILLNTQLFVQILTVQELFRYMLPNPAIRDQYNINLTEVYPCSNNTSYKINANLYQKNTTLSKLMIDGKLKLYISFDNSFSINLHTVQWDMIGGWKENSMVLNKKKACSSLRDFLGEAWIPFINSFNKKNYLCPISKGSYKMTGFDISFLKKAKWPDLYLYGSFKLQVSFVEDQGHTLGCLNILYDIFKT